MNAIQAVALGEATADLVVRGGEVVLPERRTVQSRDVAIVDGRVASLPRDASDVVGSGTTVIDATRKTVVPGLVDAHTHVDVLVAFERTYHRLLATGTTTVVTETSSIAGGLGPAGVEVLLEATADLPVAVYATVPPQSLLDTFTPTRSSGTTEPSSETTAPPNEATVEKLAELLHRNRIVGVGEIGWINVVGRDAPVERLVERSRAAGKRVCGHGAGCRGRNLTAFATVVDDDHEAITDDGVVERVENGIHVIGRCGSIRDDTAAIATALDRVDPNDLSLSTDGVWPGDLLESGAMDAAVRRLVDQGVEPVDAIRMATLNPARHFGLHDRGTLAPGAVADVAIVEDLPSMTVETVLAGGEVVVQNGEPLVEPRPFEYPEEVTDSVAVDVDRSPFPIPADAVTGDSVRAIRVESGLLTSETVVEPNIVDDRVVATPGNEVLGATLFDRRPDGDGSSFTGFVTGLGPFEGAVATTSTWETAGLLAVGSDEADVHLAVEHVASMGGGWAVVHDETVIASVAQPIGAVCADVDVESAATAYERVQTALAEFGLTVDDPLLALQTLTFTGVPALKLTHAGYADVRGRRLLGLDPDQESVDDSPSTS